jgi:predicted nuclease of predicted toxin-antitoxin system
MSLFIADEQIPMPAIDLLRLAGHDVLSISEQFAALDDAEIVHLALAENRIIITCDSDFGELIFLRQLECRTGVVYLRLGDFSVIEPADFILRYLTEEEDIFEGKFSVITRKRIRQREL